MVGRQLKKIPTTLLGPSRPLRSPSRDGRATIMLKRERFLGEFVLKRHHAVVTAEVAGRRVGHREVIHGLRFLHAVIALRSVKRLALEAGLRLSIGSLFQADGIDGDLVETQAIQRAHHQRLACGVVPLDHVEIVLFHFAPTARDYPPVGYDVNVLATLRTKAVLHVVVEYRVLLENFKVEVSSTHIALAGYDVIHELESDETRLPTKQIHFIVVFVFHRNWLFQEAH